MNLKQSQMTTLNISQVKKDSPGTENGNYRLRTTDLFCEILKTTLTKTTKPKTN